MEQFYVKYVAGSVSLYHRPSHCYISYFGTKEECAAYIGELNLLTPEMLWHSLLYDYKIRMPHADTIKGISSRRADDGWKESEAGYQRAWGMHTKRFYEEYPDILVDEEVPFDLIAEVRRREDTRRYKAELEAARKKRKIFLKGDRIIIRTA